MDEDTEADYIADMLDAGEVDLTDDGTDEDDTDEDDALVAELDGMTSAELADVFNTTAKELRVNLRKLGLGVGKGRRYYLGADDIKMVKAVYAG